MNCNVSERTFKKLLQEVHHENVSLNSILQFRKEHPNILWSEIVYKKTGDSILHVASRIGEEKVVRYILEKWHPKTVDIKNKDCKTPLHEAAQFSHARIVQLLLNNSAQIDAIKRADWTPLMLACSKSGEYSLEVISILLNAGASCKQKNKDGWTPLHLACRTGDVNIVKLLLNHNSEVLYTKTYNGRTVLHIACLHGHLEIAKMLLEMKVPVNIIDKCGNTPLHDAVCSDSQGLVCFLIEMGAKDSFNNAGLGCLHIAAGAGLNDMIQFLINDLRMNPNLLTKTSVSPLHCAARNRKNSTVDLLIKLGSSSTIKDIHNRTASDYLDL